MHYEESRHLLEEDLNDETIKAVYSLEKDCFDDQMFMNQYHLLMKQSVLPDDFKKAIEGSSTILHNVLEPIKVVKRYVLASNIIPSLVLLIVLFIPLILYLTNVKDYQKYFYYIYPPAIVLYLLGMIIVNVLGVRGIRNHHHKAKLAIENYIAFENRNKFRNHGVRLKLSYDPRTGFGRYTTSAFTFGELPYIEVYFSTSPLVESVHAAQPIVAAPYQAAVPQPQPIVEPIVRHVTKEHPFEEVITTVFEEEKKNKK
jgi:hypothetical protein